jgi:hypothetical protein
MGRREFRPLVVEVSLVRLRLVYLQRARCDEQAPAVAGKGCVGHLRFGEAVLAFCILV